MKNVLLLLVIHLACGVSAARAEDLIGVERYGRFLPVGTLVRFPAEDPSSGEIIGDTGLREVGAIDFLDGRLWAVGSAEGVYGFYVVHPSTAEAQLISRTSIPVDEGHIFGGSFDAEGTFWLTRSIPFWGPDVIALDPYSGDESERFRMGSGWTVGGLSWVDDVLYALSTYSFGILDLERGLISGIVYAPGPCSGGAMGLDAAADGTSFFYTCSLGSADGPDSRLYRIDSLSATVVDLGDVIPRATLDAIAVVPPPLEVGIDVIPRSPANRINPDRGGRFRVAVLGSMAFDAGEISSSSVRMGPGAAAPIEGRDQLRDVDKDGFDDLILMFQVRDARFDRETTEACLEGETFDGRAFVGCDAVHPVPR